MASPSAVAVKHAVKALRSVGEIVTAVDFRPDGSFRVLTVANQDASDAADLDGELEAWRKANGDG